MINFINFHLEKQDIARLILRELCRKLPVTRSGKGLFIRHSEAKSIITGITASFVNSFFPIYIYSSQGNRLNLGYAEFTEVTRIILDGRLASLPYASHSGRRIPDKEGALEKFLDGVVAEFGEYGFFGNLVSVGKYSRVTEIISSLRPKELPGETDVHSSRNPFLVS